METKKSPNVDLDRFHHVFLEIGFVLSLGICFLAFELKTEVKSTELKGELVVQEIENEMIPITRQEQVKPPEPPPPPKVVEVLNIVSDDVEIEDELEIIDTEADEDTKIDINPVVSTIEEEEEEEESQVFYIVEEMPEFPGGELALRKFIANSIQYPVVAQENGIEGKVYVRFVVNADGRVSNAEVIRSVDPALDKEAIRVVSNLPIWKPGKQRGKPVRVAFSVPISFVLQ
ncbi:energy transducer TonB [Sunxiuqinia sp. A32]|uniref:energy transducer TonB n=1 Tax=Sunxiuqinia sp. A32 TaxID=3461496 RepID=UPI004045F135